MCFADKRQGLSEPSLLPQGDLQELRSTNMSNPLENSKWEMMERGLSDTGLLRLHDRNGGAGVGGQRRCYSPGDLAVCVARTNSAARVQGARRCDPPLAGRLVHTCPQDAGLRAGGWPACVLRSWRDAVSAALTCACMSTVVRTGRDAKAADRVPVSRDPRPLMGSRHKNEGDRRPRPPATPATFEFQPPRCKLTAQFAEANPRRRRGREPITVPSASGATPPESRLFWPAGARELDSLDPTSGSALSLFLLSPSFARSSLHFRSVS